MAARLTCVREWRFPSNDAIDDLRKSRATSFSISVTFSEAVVKAHEKIQAIGPKALADATGISLSVIYRYAKALERGTGISRKGMEALIRVTAGQQVAFSWADFAPSLAKAA